MFSKKIMAGFILALMLAANVPYALASPSFNPATPVIEADNTVFHFDRSASRSDGGGVYINQDLNRNIYNFNELYLSANVKILHNNLKGSGWWADEHNSEIEKTGEYPIHLFVYYTDSNGEEHVWSHGFLTEKNVNDLKNYNILKNNVWYKFTSKNLMDLNPRPYTINRVEVGGNGWDFSGSVDNVALLGSNPSIPVPPLPIPLPEPVPRIPEPRDWISDNLGSNPSIPVPPIEEDLFIIEKNLILNGNFERGNEGWNWRHTSNVPDRFSFQFIQEYIGNAVEIQPDCEGYYDPNGGWHDACKDENHPAIDVAIVIDSTGSMSDELTMIKAELKRIIAEVGSGTPRPNLRVALIPYRDHPPEDTTYVYKMYDFTENVEEAMKNIMQINADGGGDGPEAVSDALRAAVIDLSWRESKNVKKLVFLIGDAPPHGEEDNGYLESHPWKKVAESARDRGMVIYTVGASGLENYRTGVSIFKEIARITGGSYSTLSYRTVNPEEFYEEKGFEPEEVQIVESDASVFDAARGLLNVNSIGESLLGSMKSEAASMGVDYKTPVEETPSPEPEIKKNSLSGLAMVIENIRLVLLGMGIRV